MNRLAREKSPYLLQHADNPVDWYPWGEEAFEKARREDKPIFLSIGYSTCHWCHVMERESFEDPAVAALLNQHFVSIKVDREERPDVDNLYMQAVMAMAGQGGWPLSVFLSPELHPFYGGTYFPPEDRWGHPGFKSVLRGVADAWANRREEILKSGRSMVETLEGQAAAGAAGGAPLSQEALSDAFRAFSQAYDETHGGFEPAPKFPRSHSLSFLLRYWKRSGDALALKVVEHTLRAMAAGGIYDHVGGGFHRYSTDARWHVPHFEKMLYDQALLARTYLEAYQATGAEEYAGTAREILEYVLRDLTGPEGGFYSAEDADSLEAPSPALSPRGGEGKGEGEKREGAFYVWTAQEIGSALGPADAELFGYLYGVQRNGNVGHDPTGEFSGKNILYRAHSVREAAVKFGRTEAEVAQLEQRSRRKLFDLRLLRPRPHLDDKVLTDWNGLMISALALASRVLEEPRYAEAARRSADFILSRLVVHPEQAAHPSTQLRMSGASKGRLLHRYRDGEAAVPGTLEDHAFLIHGLLDLYEATFEVRYLAQAKRLTHEMVRLFWDDSRGGFFLTGSDAQQLLVRQKEVYDGAIPSGNSFAALDLLRVGRLSMDRELERKASRLMEAFSAQVRQNPTAFPQLLIALDFALGPSSEIVIAGPAEDDLTRQMVRSVYRRFLPNRVLVLHPPGEPGRAVEEIVPFVKDQGMQGGKPTAYVCRNYACDLPVTSVEKLTELLEKSQ